MRKDIYLGTVMGALTELGSNSDYIYPSTRCVDAWGTMVSGGMAVYAYGYQYGAKTPTEKYVWAMFMAVPNVAQAYVGLQRSRFYCEASPEYDERDVKEKEEEN
eukprot:CAMPEP_0176357042 /NCGR_PEP_ID=MMETSP0126-20121128/14476_1 /TAXON_ID=141414 ORGANISM="Strombidinopsis acuminatum, Strain SPMC142" /NCGR_SAMPLE_ID=MMETSP0126 /ASSEMBLY_ACC=CAM_ASM_000229 /LENGTH=103 /DNA_ID=CAMNT_0017710451 /DNA_START=165 /DNA_END=476 /DNA_ORIENTATION=-